MRTFAALLTALAVLGSASYALALGGGGGRRGGGGGGGGGASNSTNAFQVTQTPPGDVNLNESPDGGAGGSDGGPNSASAVPEPGTLVLLASGAAGLVSWARRRR
jgi:PEP-CTERM motif-containing protein